MKCIKNTDCDSATLNVGDPIIIDITITDETSVIKSPQEIVVDNSSEATVGILYLDGDTEVNTLTTHPEWYDYLPLQAGRSTANIPSSTKYLYIKLITGTATGNVDIYLLNYFRG